MSPRLSIEPISGQNTEQLFDTFWVLWLHDTQSQLAFLRNSGTFTFNWTRDTRHSSRIQARNEAFVVQITCSGEESV